MEEEPEGIAAQLDALNSVEDLVFVVAIETIAANGVAPVLPTLLELNAAALAHVAAVEVLRRLFSGLLEEVVFVAYFCSEVEAEVVNFCHFWKLFDVGDEE